MLVKHFFQLCLADQIVLADLLRGQVGGDILMEISKDRLVEGFGFVKQRFKFSGRGGLILCRAHQKDQELFQIGGDHLKGTGQDLVF